jgi:hypothetical protein
MIALVALQEVSEQVAIAQQGIGTYALVFMLLSMGAVTALTAWCYWRIMTTRRHFDPDGLGPAHSPVPGEVEKGRPPGR